MYRYSDTENISLHDCRANEILYSDYTVSFVFEKGFTVTARSSFNNDNKSAYTDRAEVRFRLSGKEVNSNITIYLFEKTENKTRSVREEILFSELAERINNGMVLEFISSYRGEGAFLYKCCLWLNEEPYRKDCELLIYADEAEYFWNNIFYE